MAESAARRRWSVLQGAGAALDKVSSGLESRDAFEARVEQLEHERAQLAILLGIARRYLARAGDPVDVLFSLLHRVTPFEAAFAAVITDRVPRYVPHPSGLTLTAEECRRIHRECEPKRTVVFDGPGEELKLQAFVARSRALIPTADGGFIALLAETPGLYSPEAEFLELLGRVHSAALAGERG